MNQIKKKLHLLYILYGFVSLALLIVFIGFASKAIFGN